MSGMSNPGPCGAPGFGLGGTTILCGGSAATAGTACGVSAGFGAAADWATGGAAAGVFVAFATAGVVADAFATDSVLAEQAPANTRLPTAKTVQKHRFMSVLQVY
jgi:hypothetical protein